MTKSLQIVPEKCTGCMQCVLACSFVQTGSFQPSRSVIRVNVFDEEASYAPYTCLQCQEAWCMMACPVNAIAVDPRTIYFYWEVRPTTLAHARARHPEGWLCVRVASVTATWEGPLVDAVVRAKPTGSKGTYLRTFNVASTMGPGIELDQAAAILEKSVKE